MINFLRSRIIGTKPWTEDEKEVTEQVVVVELPDGEKMGLFDNFKMVVTPDMVGHIKSLLILVQISKINQPSIVGGTIEPDRENPLQFRNHVYTGRVEKIAVKDVWHGDFGYTNLVSVNVGYGDILVAVDRKLLNKLKIGDYLRILAVRSDLLEAR